MNILNEGYLISKAAMIVLAAKKENKASELLGHTVIVAMQRQELDPEFLYIAELNAERSRVQYFPNKIIHVFKYNDSTTLKVRIKW